VQCELGAIAQLELLQQARDAVAHRLQRQAHLIGDLAVGVPAGEQLEHLAIGLVELVDPHVATLGESLLGAADDGRREERNVGCGIEDDLVQFLDRAVLADDRTGASFVAVDECCVGFIVDECDDLGVLVDGLGASSDVETGACGVGDVDDQHLRLLAFDSLDEGVAVALGDEHLHSLHRGHCLDECFADHFLWFTESDGNHVHSSCFRR